MTGMAKQAATPKRKPRSQPFGTGRTLVLRPDRLAALRRKADMTQEELAARTGASQPTISLWERGLKQPGSDALVWALAEALAVKVPQIAVKAPKESAKPAA
jgi:transcriptional regulator with XRE-family HTH domain